jgi:hypothetical protein
MARRLATILLALGALSAAPAAQAADLARVDRPTPIAAYGGRLAWSTYDAATKRYSLTTRVGDRTTTVPVAPRSVPFDVDLGPRSDGAVAATYSRCRVEAPPARRARGCDVYLYDFSTGAETRVTHASAPDANESWPSLWRGTLAFARDYDDKPGLGYVYTRTIASGRPSTRQPGGARSRCNGCNPPPASRAEQLDLYGKRLGFAWLYLEGGEGLDSEIRIDTVGGGHQRVAHQNGGGLTQVQLGWPAFESGNLYWSVSCIGDPGGCPGRYGLRRLRYATGDLAHAPGPRAPLSHDRDGGRTFLLTDTQPGTDCLGDPSVPGGTCAVNASEPAFG